MPFHSLHLGSLGLRTWTLLGQAPVLALMVALYFSGRRRGWAWRPAVLATAALAAGMSLGAALLPSVLGAVAGGIALWLLAQRLLGLRRAPLAALAIGLVVVVAVGRWGCLLNDCCFGRAADLPWAIHYGEGSATWILHRALGWIAADAHASLPVHPYPLYESAGLLCWLPVALWLRRRLRSESALLLFTAAFDLALRGLIDGTRAMVNVWWALLDTRLGLNLFQWALCAAALACVALGMRMERRAGRATELDPAMASEPAPERAWLVFVGLLGVGWLTDAEQTLFLHRYLVGALAVSALALRLPAWLPARRWLRVAAAPAVAIVLVVALGSHVERAAQAGAGAALEGNRRGWLYEVDHGRGVLVRVGTQQESPERADERRKALDLPSTPVAGPAPAQPSGAAGRLWVGGGVLGGAANYRVQNGCSEDYIAYDRKLGGGWLQGDYELPATPTSVWWLGGRGTAVFETQKKTQHGGGNTLVDTVDYYTLRGYDGQVWGEWEHPNITVGIGAMVGLQDRLTEAGSSSLQGAGGTSSLSAVVRPSFRLRAGFSFLGVDGGAYDRQSFAGSTSAHIGISGAIGRGFTRVRHPADTVFKYYLGAVILPGADAELNRFLLGLGLEAFVTRRLALGLQGGTGEGSFLAGYVRATIGP